MKCNEQEDLYFQIRVESGGKPVARAYPPYYTRILPDLYQWKMGRSGAKSANRSAIPASAPSLAESTPSLRAIELFPRAPSEVTRKRKETVSFALTGRRKLSGSRLRGQEILRIE